MDFIRPVVNSYYAKYAKNGKMPFVCILRSKLTVAGYGVDFTYLVRSGKLHSFRYEYPELYFYESYEEAERFLNHWIEKNPEKWAELMAERISK